MKDRIVLINSFSKGSHHEMYNASILQILSEQNRSVIAYSDKRTFRKYLEISGVQVSIRCVPLWVFGTNSRVLLLLNYLWSALLNIFILLYSKKDDILVYLFNNAFSVVLLNRINQIMGRKVFLCCHGELELLKKKTNQHDGVLVKLLRRSIQHFFRSKFFSLRLIVAGDSIIKNLLSVIKNTNLKVYSIDHPYIFPNLLKNEKVGQDGTQRMGTVGALSRSKGSDGYMRLLNLCASKACVEFCVLGYSSPSDILSFEKLGVVFPCKEYTFCPRELFDTLIQKLDFILFFYPSDSYQFTASGAIFDALRNEIPILALRNDYFSYIFDKYGSFGYLFDTVEEMANFIHSLSAEYVCDKFDFDSIKSKLSPLNFVEPIKRIL